MRISAVVPTLNSAARLPACLAALHEADEIIVSDGGSMDDTVKIARAAGAEVIRGSPGRGVQLARGAEAARFGGLLFVHSDTVLDPLGVWRVRKHVNRSLRPACFRLRLDDPAWQARVIERAVDWRTRLLQLPYGDQALAVRRDRYQEAGGFRHLPLMEDVDLITRLPPIVILPDEATTSADRWRRDGWARRSARNLFCLALWNAGVSPERIERVYLRQRRVSAKAQGLVQPAE